MEQTDGETAALTSPESIKAQMKVAIANFQASPQQPDRPSCDLQSGSSSSRFRILNPENSKMCNF